MWEIDISFYFTKFYPLCLLKMNLFLAKKKSQRKRLPLARKTIHSETISSFLSFSLFRYSSIASLTKTVMGFLMPFCASSSLRQYNCSTISGEIFGLYIFGLLSKVLSLPTLTQQFITIQSALTERESFKLNKLPLSHILFPDTCLQPAFSSVPRQHFPSGSGKANRKNRNRNRGKVF